MKLFTISHATGTAWGALVAICAVLIYQLRLPTRCTIINDSAISSALKQRISSAITPWYAQTHTVHELHATLTTLATSIDSVAVHCDQPYHRTIHITHARPCAQLDDTTLLGIDGSCIPTEEFIPSYYERLPCIHTTHAPLTPADRIVCAAYVRSIPAEIITDYDITWHNKTEIFFSLRPDHYITLIACTQMEWKESLLTAITRLIPLLSARKVHDTRKHTYQSWLVDIRIPGHFIVRPRPVTKGTL